MYMVITYVLSLCPLFVLASGRAASGKWHSEVEAYLSFSDIAPYSYVHREVRHTTIHILDTHLPRSSASASRNRVPRFKDLPLHISRVLATI
jgi:hypothetical protein